MQVRLLGPVELVGGSGAIAVGGPKERAVLAALALRPGETVSEDSLAEALWGEATPPTATKTLRAYVSRLRKLLVDADGGGGAVAIETRPGGYVLQLGADGRDVDEVSALLDSARAAAAAGDAAWAALAFARALNAWRGRPLGEFADEPFARTESARLEELRQLVVEERIDAELACGHHSALLGELEALTGNFPLRERLWAQRMTALYRAGRQAEALQVYQQLRAALGEELGIDPSPALVELHAAILQQRASLDWVPAPQPAPTTATSAVGLPSGVVTFLLTDVEGSTALWEAHGQAMRAALARHDDILAQAVREHRGTMVKPKGEGDSAFAVFTTASDAATAALAAQRALDTEPWSEGVSIRVRMAIHTGEAELRDGDYFGSTVNRAARLRELAHGGQAVLSQAAADVLSDMLPDGAELIDLGEHRLRDLSRPERVFQLTHPDLRAQFPALRGYAAEATNLPPQTTTFIGRDRQLADVAGAIDAARVVTLTGVGGVGKTRLALQAAAAALPQYRDGAWLVDLAPTVDPAVVIEVVATALGATQRYGQTLAASVLDFLRSKRLLLLLDNCEHLLDAVAGFADGVIHACAHVCILATSREGLGVAGERIIAVPSLQLPAQRQSANDVADGDTEAVRLFVARAIEAKADFRLTDKNEAAVLQLCRRLDGIPLAIELAAARVRSLTPADLAARLDERFRLLAGGPRTAVGRHQTLRRAIDWSYDLLSDVEQVALNRLAVFAGSFDLEAAEAVLPGERLQVSDVVDLLGHLVDKSLVVVDDQEGKTRYRLLETIRSYAQDRLEASGELEALRHRHAEYYVAFTARAGEGLRGPDEVTWTPRTDAELDNLRAVLAWSVAAEKADLALGLVAPLALAGTHAGYASAPWAEIAIGLPGAPTHPLYAEVLGYAAWVAATASDLDRAIGLANEAREIVDDRSLDLLAEIRVLIQCAIVAMWSGQLDKAARIANEWLSRARSPGAEVYLSGGLCTVGTTLLVLGRDVDECRIYFDEAVAVARRVRNPSSIAHAAYMAGECRIATEPDEAQRLLDESFDAAKSVDNRYAMGIAIVFKVYLHLSQDNWPEAARNVLFASEYTHHNGDSSGLRGLCLPGAITVLARVGADEAAARLCGAVRTEVLADQVKGQFDGSVATLRDRLGNERLAEYGAQGAAMGDDEIFALVQREINARLASSD